jgi:hypothetical protein
MPLNASIVDMERPARSLLAVFFGVDGFPWRVNQAGE